MHDAAPRDSEAESRTSPAPADPGVAKPAAKYASGIADRDIKPDNVPLELPTVPVEQLTGRAQRFKCVPLLAKLRAGDCLDRQAQHRGRGVDFYLDAGGRRRPYKQDYARRSDKPRSYLGRCRNCALGQRVAARLEAQAGPSGEPPSSPAPAVREGGDGAAQPPAAVRAADDGA